MAVLRMRLPSRSPSPQPVVGLSDEVELYKRTYTTLLRSSGETLLRVLEHGHLRMQSSLHLGAASAEVDLGDWCFS